MGSDDAELIQRWQRGEAAAFEAVVRRWQEPLGRFLVRLVGRADLAQDLCQEVFLRVYLAGPKYQEAGTFSGWLYRIALNIARDASRRHRLNSQPWPTIEPAAKAPTAVADCERRELIQIVEKALAELPASQREVLVLRHYEGMRFEEMARLLGVPASTLKSRFAAALQRMRVRLEQLGWSHEETES